MKVNNDQDQIFQNDLKNFYAPELYKIKLDLVNSDFKKYAIIDEIFELHLLLQDEIYHNGRSHNFSIYLSLLENIKKYILLDKYLDADLFRNLYYSSYKRYYELVDEICDLSGYNIEFLKILQNIEDEYGKQAYDSGIKKFLININKNSTSIEQDMFLLGEKWDICLIVSILKKLKYLQYDVDSACSTLGTGVLQDEAYNRLREVAVLKINNIINDKIELARCLHELNNEQFSLQSYYEIVRLRDVIRIINHDWFYHESELALQGLEKVVIYCQKVKYTPGIPKIIGFFGPKKSFTGNDLSIFNDLIRMPSESDIENITAFGIFCGLDLKEIMRLITERQERQRTLIFDRLCSLSRK